MKTIQANKTADRRTINRVKEHGPVFEILETREMEGFGGGFRWTLLRSVKTNWLGWLPESEIMIF